MSNHPNRGPKGPASNPSPAEVKAARAATRLTQTQAAAVVYSTIKAWQTWENGTRRMPPGLWELFQAKTLDIRDPLPAVLSINWSVLPPRLRDNWHVYVTVRSQAQISYARAHANSVTKDMSSPMWIEAFDRAADAWLKANPADPKWAGDWPDGADIFLGNEATEQAIHLIESADA